MPASVALLTQALVWLHGEECRESTVVAIPQPPYTKQESVPLGQETDYNLSRAPSTCCNVAGCKATGVTV